MGPGKTFQQERATLAAHHEALEVDLLGHGKGIDLLDYYRGKLSWRRLSMLIRHFMAEPSSALFKSIERSVVPTSTEPVPHMTYHQQMQVLAWSQLHELVLMVANEVRSGFAAMAQTTIPALPHPWERSDGDAAVNVALSNEYNSARARAARAAVTGAPIEGG